MTDPQTTKSDWINRYALHLNEMNGARITDGLKKAHASWDEMSDEEKEYVSPETCCEDEND